MFLHTSCRRREHENAYTADMTVAVTILCDIVVRNSRTFKHSLFD